MRICTSKYQWIDYEGGHKLFIWTSLPNDDAIDMLYKQAMLEYLELAIKYKPQRLILDSRQSKYAVVPELQEWTAKHISSYTQKFIKKIAIIHAADIFAQVSTEQLMTEKGIVEHYETNYFEDMESARKWILS